MEGLALMLLGMAVMACAVVNPKGRKAVPIIAGLIAMVSGAGFIMAGV